jgi:hypothetical protein
MRKVAMFKQTRMIARKIPTAAVFQFGSHVARDKKLWQTLLASVSSDAGSIRHDCQQATGEVVVMHMAQSLAGKSPFRLSSKNTIVQIGRFPSFPQGE